MQQRSATTSTGLILAMTILVNGCGSDRGPDGRDSALSSKDVKTVVLDSNLVDIDHPVVSIEDDVVTLSGSIHRKTGVQGPFSGRMDIEFISSDGEQLDFITALFYPRNVPVNPNESSTYSTSYGYVPPPGSTVRVHFVDAVTEAREDLEGGPGDAVVGTNGAVNTSVGNTPRTAAGTGRINAHATRDMHPDHAARFPF